MNQASKLERDPAGAGEGETPGAAASRTPPRPGAMSRAVGRGMVWMMGMTVLGRSASALSQIIVANFLLEEDFGIAAMALAFGAFVQVFRDGGVRRLLIQRGADEYAALAGPLFWMAAAFNLATSAIIFATAPLVAHHVYHEPQVRDLLWVIAVYPILSTPAAILQARLNIDLRFRAISLITAGSSIIRYGGIVLFAWLGLGPMSFVLPMPLVAIWEGVASFVVTRDSPWTSAPRFAIWWDNIRRAAWVMLGTLATTVYNQGDYLVLGIITTKAVVGVYFFAYGLSKQVIILLVVNLQTVLFPALSKFADDDARQRSAAKQTIRLLTLLSAPLSFGLISVIDPLETVLFDGRWSGAVAPIQLLSLALPFIILNTIPRTVLMSRGEFKAWSIILLLDGVGVMISAAIGAYITLDSTGVFLFQGEARDPVGIAACVAAYSSVSSLAYSWIALRSIDLPFAAMLRSFSPPVAIAAIASLAAMLVERALGAGVPAEIQVIAAGLVFSAIFGLTVRRVLAGDLRALISVAPAPLRRPAST
ncbi:MAG: oligosaccharide flippase family protein, partial [Planctomycetota bacterium]|nr:oligosaccharide flippase family protein [Planctomycetota bacterium]